MSLYTDHIDIENPNFLTLRVIQVSKVWLWTHGSDT